MLHYTYVYNERSFLTSGLEAEYQCKQSKSKKYLSALESLVWWANCLGNMATKIDSSTVSNLQRILHNHWNEKKAHDERQQPIILQYIT